MSTPLTPLGQLVGINSEAMGLGKGKERVWYLIPNDTDSDAAFICIANESLCIEINLPRASAMNGYEAYLRDGWQPLA